MRSRRPRTIKLHTWNFTGPHARGRKDIYAVLRIRGPSFVHRRDGMGSPVVSEEVRSYFQRLASQVDATYAVARAARARRFDPELAAEVPLTDHLASRGGRLLEHHAAQGAAGRIRGAATVHA